MKTRAFTLIELLIVVAIIAILAAIAVPNFLEAQVRSKVSACRADIRSIVTALESYRLDYDAYPYYPVWREDYVRNNTFGSANKQFTFEHAGYTPILLTTPVPYLSALPRDKFAYARNSGKDATGKSKENPLNLYIYDHEGSDPGFWAKRMVPGIAYILVGVGPDLHPAISSGPGTGYNNATEYLQDRPGAVGLGGFYDPSNGTVSAGDIVYHGPGLGFEAAKTFKPTAD